MIGDRLRSALSRETAKKQKRNRMIAGLVIVLVVGAVFLSVFLKFGVGIPCIFNKVTGLQCPGCGMTRAIAEIWKGNFVQALEYNALSLTVFPVVCLYMFYREIRYVNGTDKGFHIWECIVLLLLWIATVGYGVIRNII